MSNHSVQGYEVMFVLRDALERAGSMDRDKLREAIAKTNLTDQILTQESIRFDDIGRGHLRHPRPHPGAERQAGGGRPRASFAEAKPIFPVPKWKG